MAGRHAVAVRARGGEVIQAPRPARARLITALAAFAVLASAVVYVGAGDGRFASFGAVLGGIGLLVLALGLALRWPGTIPWAVLLTGAGYVVGLFGSSSVDGWAAVIGVVLLASAELASWSIEHDARIHAEPALVVRRIATLAGLLVAALLVDFLLLGSSGVGASGSVLVAAVGVAAAVAAIGVVLRQVRA